DFDDYFKSLRPSSNSRNPWFKEFWENQFNCVFKNSRSAKKRKLCTGKEDISEYYRQEGLVPMVIDSVLLLATAIKTLCTEYSNFCKEFQKTEMKYRNAFVDIIENTSLKSSQGHNMMISFDKSRSVPVNYTIFQFRKVSRSSDNYAYRFIGEWNPDKRLRLLEDPTWNSYEVDELGRPVSSCSKECALGEERIRNTESNRRCCWTCRPCDDIYYLPERQKPCIPCPDGKVPSRDWKSCVDMEVEFIGQKLGNPWALVPLTFSILGLISTSVVFIIFFMNHKTPIIMASGRELCYVILVGIVFCYCFPFVVLLKPNQISCGILRIGMGLGLSVCYSAIFTKTNRLSRIFEVSMKITKRPSYISPESQVMICVCLVLIQVTLTVLWLIVKPPVILNALLENPKKWVSYCGLDGISVLLGLFYNMILLLLCTIYAYKTRNIPENFNETKWISFTMYSSCIIWLAFIPIYCSAMQDYKVRSTILSMSVSVSGTVTLVCIFLPKIYIVLFHPERNVRYPSSSATSGTGTCSSQPVRFVRTAAKANEVQQPSPINRPDSSFLVNQNHIT
ncbi:metabotropic glutamate receptor 3, partial [Nephila pilipes]